MLLRAVVQVALHPAALGVAAGHDAGPGLAQLVGLLAQLVQRGLQRGVQPRVVHCQADLPGQLGQHPVVLVGERVGGGGPLRDDQPEQLAGVADRRDPDLDLGPPVQHTGQPDRGPGVPGNPGPGHDSALPVRHHDRPRSGVRHRGDAFQHVALPV